MYFNVKKNNEMEVGDIFVTHDGEIRMIIQDSLSSEYATIELNGRVYVSWYSCLDDLLSNYSIKEFYKNKDLKIVDKES